MLFFETSTTLRVLMPAILMVMGCGLAMSVLAPDTLAALRASEPETMMPSASSLLYFSIIGLVGLLAYALMAVLWHRHVLLNGAEDTEVLRPAPSVYLGYIWRAIVVGMVQILAVLPLTLAIALLGGAVVSAGAGGLPVSVIGVLGSVIFIWIALRFSVVLPAAAIGERMAVLESWQITRAVSAELWGVAAMITGINTLFYTLSLILPEAGVLPMLAQTVILIIEGLMFISVLTTLYGHLVEGRSLGQ
ncbi:Membrane protein [Sulfitobacter noctilucae]|nr:Membrane protein [Sulfitobacter noctilucae]